MTKTCNFLACCCNTLAASAEIQRSIFGEHRRRHAKCFDAVLLLVATCLEVAFGFS